MVYYMFMSSMQILDILYAKDYIKMLLFYKTSTRSIICDCRCCQAVSDCRADNIITSILILLRW